METFKLIIKIMKLILAAWDFLEGKYDEHSFKKKIEEIKTGIAQSESEDDYVAAQGTSAIEDAFGNLDS